MAEIVLNKVNKIYSGKQNFHAVRDMDLTIRDREFMVFLGPSGCGKTSTLRMIAGLEEVTSGTISFDSRPVNDLRPQERNISLAFENYALYPTLKVWENIAFPLRIRQYSQAELEQKVEWAAQALQISDILQKRPHELSGGQQQRVSLARAIVRNPAVFLFDEPLSHLDMKQRQRMRAEIKHLHADLQSTVLHVTHDQKEAMALADRIAVMHNGQLQQVGSPLEIYQDPVNEFVAGFIGEPPMNFVDCRVRLSDAGVELLAGTSMVFARMPNAPSQNMDLEKTSKLRLGIRARRIQVASADPGEGFVAATVFVYESIGEKGILTVSWAGQRLNVLTKPDLDYQKQDPIWLAFPVEHLYCFSLETGERLRSLEVRA